MPNYNLNDPNDFAAITSVFGSALGPAQNQVWNITEASYGGVLFHVFKSAPGWNAGLPQVKDRYGRRKIKYQFPFQDGQTTGDLGRSPNIFEFDVVFFGPTYLSGYFAFTAALMKPTPQPLIHPVLNVLPVSYIATEWEVTHQNTERMALTMHVVFEEHTYDTGVQASGATGAQSSLTSPPSTFKKAVIGALSAFQAIDSVISAVQAQKAVVTSVINGISNEVSTYKTLFLTTLQSIYLTFSPDNVTLSTDLPGVLPVQLGGAATTTGAQATNVYPFVNQNQTPFANITSTESTPFQTAVQQAQASVNAVRAQAETAIQAMNSANNGDGAFLFYAQVLALKQGAYQLQQALQQGIASSSAQTTQFTVPYTMSIRNVAFLIGLAMDNVDQLIQLNPTILSANYIALGTVLTVPVVS